jgi:hypothetical protein
MNIFITLRINLTLQIDLSTQRLSLCSTFKNISYASVLYSLLWDFLWILTHAHITGKGYIPEVQPQYVILAL